MVKNSPKHQHKLRGNKIRSKRLLLLQRYFIIKKSNTILLFAIVYNNL